jgi:ABC-type Fe3+ transport system permease subunit
MRNLKLYELSWLWQTLVITLAVAAVCVVCAMLICKAVKKNLSKKTATAIGTAAFAGGSHCDCPDSDAALIKRDA